VCFTKPDDTTHGALYTSTSIRRSLHTSGNSHAEAHAAMPSCHCRVSVHSPRAPVIVQNSAEPYQTTVAWSDSLWVSEWVSVVTSSITQWVGERVGECSDVVDHAVSGGRVGECSDVFEHAASGERVSECSDVFERAAFQSSVWLKYTAAVRHQP
jgi:hypothetical protein